MKMSAILMLTKAVAYGQANFEEGGVLNGRRRDAPRMERKAEIGI